jgi:ABC-2 type transport system permease protein
VAWQFVRLKLRITGRILRTGSAWSLLGTILIWLLAVVGGLGGGALVALAARFLDQSLAWAVLVGVGIQAIWVLVPIVASAIDATINPRWFELLPLSTSELGRGLLAAGMVGPGGLASVLVVGIGLGVGYWPGWWGVVTVPALALLLTFIGVVSGQLATACLSDFLARSSGAVLGPVLGLGIAAVASSIAGAISESGDFRPDIIPSWLAWLSVVPGGAVALAMSQLETGAWGWALLALMWGLITAWVLTWAHGREIARLQTRSVTQRRARSRRGGGSVLGENLKRLVPATDLRVAAAKEGRYLRRDPRLRAQIVGAVVTVVVFGYVGATLIPSDYAPFVAVAVTWAIVTSLAPNQFGVDAGSFWAYVANPTNVARVLAGKNVMWGLVAAPPAVLAAAAGAVVAGSPRYLAAALLASASVALIWMMVGNMTSIFGPFPLPERQVFSTGPTAGRAIAVSLGGLAVSGALTTPMIVVMGVALYLGGARWATLAGVVAVTYAAVLFRFGFRWAQSAVVERQFLMLEALDRP